MTRGRHSLAPRASKPRRFALFAAPLITCGLVAAGVALTGLDTSGGRVDLTSASAGAAADLGNRTNSLSRSADRVVVASVAGAVANAAPAIADRLWTTADLDLRLEPTAGSAVDGQFPSMQRIAVTGVRHDGFAQVVVAGQVRWVSAEYLAARKPTDPAHLPLIDKPCPGTSGVENGLQPGAIRVYRAVCNQFPQITTYGGWAARGEHSSGRALDIMTTDVTLGNEIAAFLQAHAAELNLYDIIWRQRIWTPVRAGEGWRPMPDRGSPTANHMNHVHVSTN